MRTVRELLKIDTDAARRRWDDRVALTVGLFATLVILGALVGAAVMLLRLWKVGIISPNGNPLHIVFASRMMVASARLAVLFLGVYIVLSILMHMRRGQWLTAAGPFKVSESVRKLDATSMRLQAERDKALNENRRLRTQRHRSLSELERLRGVLGEAEEELRRRGELDD